MSEGDVVAMTIFFATIAIVAALLVVLLVARNRRGT
jgi:hypothetical protein